MENDLALLVRWFESAEEASQGGRRESEQARDYYDGKQLTAEERKVLRRRRQPEVIINRIKRKIDFLRGLERQSRTDPVAYPRTIAHEDAAHAVTDALRYVADDQKFDMKRSQLWDNMLVEGFGAMEIRVAKTRGGIDPELVRIPWDRCFFDPHSAEPDFSDARYLGYVTWMDEDEAKKKWPEAAAVIETTMSNPVSSNADTYDDKPKWAMWGDKDRKRVRIVSICYRVQGEWHWCKMTLAGFVAKPEPIPFLDEEGRPECPLIFQSAYVDRDNDRYGVVRDMISPQDEVNKRRSKSLHLLTMRQVRVSRSASQDPEEVRRELAKPDGVLMGEDGEVEILNNNDQVAGHLQLMQEAKGEIDNLGPNATLQGKAGQDQSGRAIMALQQGGMVELAPLLDQLRNFNLRAYRQIWNRIRQYWTEERWVRVTDDERGVRFVGLNTTQGALAALKLREAMAKGKIDQQTAQQYALQLQADPAMMRPANDVAELDVDIQIDEVADTPTVQMEQFEQLVKTLPVLFPQGSPPEVLELVVQASSLRDKSKLLDILKQAQDAASQPNPQQQLMIADATAKIEETKSKTLKNVAQAQSMGQPEQTDPTKEVEVLLHAEEVRTDQFRAVTERMTAMNPPQPQAA